MKVPQSAKFYEFRKRLMIMLIAIATTSMMPYLNIKTAALTHPKTRCTYFFVVSKTKGTIYNHGPFAGLYSHAVHLNLIFVVFFFFRSALSKMYNQHVYRIPSPIYHFNYKKCPMFQHPFDLA